MGSRFRHLSFPAPGIIRLLRPERHCQESTVGKTERKLHPVIGGDAFLEHLAVLRLLHCRYYCFKRATDFRCKPWRLQGDAGGPLGHHVGNSDVFTNHRSGPILRAKPCTKTFLLGQRYCVSRMATYLPCGIGVSCRLLATSKLGLWEGGKRFDELRITEIEALK